MSRYLFSSFAVLLVAGVSGCETTKLQRDMLEDSTWETSQGEEDWNAEGKRPSRKERKQNEAWEKKNAPMEEVPAAQQSQPESNLDQPYRRVSEGVIARTELLPVLDDGLAASSKMFRPSPRFTRAPSWASASSASFLASPRSHRSTFVLVTPSRASTASQSSGRSRLLRSGKSCGPLPISSSTIGEKAKPTRCALLSLTRAEFDSIVPRCGPPILLPSIVVSPSRPPRCWSTPLWSYSGAPTSVRPYPVTAAATIGPCATGSPSRSTLHSRRS